MRRRSLVPLALVLLFAPLGRAADVRPAVARPSLRLGKETRSAGTAFFIETTSGRFAAVTTAHGFEPADLTRANEVELALAHSSRRVAVASRLLAPPGRPYHAPGATVRDDFLLLALDAAPAHVRLLALDERALPEVGERVQILGIPADGPHDEDDLYGEIATLSREAIEVDLDTPADLRGWGGAPVLAYDTKRVVGFVQAARPVGATLRLTVSPLGGLRAALSAALAQGEGIALASAGVAAASGATDPAAKAKAARVQGTSDEGGRASARAAPGGSPPAASAEPAQTRDAGAASKPRGDAARAPASTPGSGGAGPAAQSDAEKRAGAGKDEDAGDAVTASAGDARRPAGETLVPKQAVEPLRLQIEIDTPSEGAVLGDASGAFVSGRALALHGVLRRFDVVIVLDTSASTEAPSGADIDGDGKKGTAPIGGVGVMVGLGNTDDGDSILAAEVLAAKRLVESLDPRSTRVGLVSFAGEPPNGPYGSSEAAALTEEPLTSDHARVQRALDDLLRRGPEGSTHIAAGLDQATVELLGLSGASSKSDAESEKIVLFLTDGQPTLPYPGMERENVRAVLRAVERARRAGIRVHTFGIGPDALEGPVAIVEMAARTRGWFTPVRNPAEIVDVMEHVRFADVESVSVRNLTSGAAADASFASADGSFGALVPLVAGENRLEVVVRTTEGRSEARTVVVRFEDGAKSLALSREQLAQRNRLLQQRLLVLQREGLAKEMETARRQQKELEIERERAQERAASQREDLDLGTKGGATH